jgi:hypothetical protein
MLVLSIVTTLLVMAMFSFNRAAVDARTRVVELRAESAATRVSGLVVQASLVAERQGNASQVRFLVDLPADLEGQAYQIALQDAIPAQVQVTVPGLKVTATAELFSANLATGVSVCPSTVDGGHLYVRFDQKPPGSGTRCLFLETAP